MTDDDDPQEDSQPGYEPDRLPARHRWLVPALLFGIALLLGLMASAFLVHAHKATKVAISTDVAAPTDPVHKPLPAPTAGVSIGLPQASSIAADAPHIESAASDEVAQPSSEASTPDASASAPEIAPASSASPSAAGPTTEDTEPQVLARSQPVYPEEALRSGVEGEVRLKVTIDTQGSVSDVHVESSSGSSELDRAAIDSMRTWHFKPAMHDGQPAEGTIEVPLRFSLGDQR